jgi:dihydrolipoamide dehydrogenase
MADYDVVVIGAGPGGYVAAIRCAQLGLKTACVEKWINAEGKPALGGVCLNVGCIPSKALLESSHHYYALRHKFKEHGINVKDASIDISTMMQRKDTVVAKLTSGIETLFRKNKVTWLQGHARLLSNNTVEVTGLGNTPNREELTANHIIIASGSTPVELEMAPFDGDLIVDSTGGLSFSQVPKRLGVIGGGVVGLELGSVWQRLGAEVVILNRSKKFLRSVDQQIAKLVYKELQSQGLTIHLGVQLAAVEKGSGEVSVSFTDSKGEQQLKFDKLLVARGRRPNSDQLNAHEAGLKINQRGFIEVDDLCRTSLQGVYAIGDVVRGPMLAHKASEEGIAVAERIAGQETAVDFHKVPWVIYIQPELAWVGSTTEELEKRDVEFKSGTFPLFANGRALAMGESTGMVKILSDAKTDKILGVHIYAPNASELISEAVLAMEFSASAEDIARTIHAHPTVSEAIHEAALAVDKRPIHM